MKSNNNEKRYKQPKLLKINCVYGMYVIHKCSNALRLIPMLSYTVFAFALVASSSSSSLASIWTYYIIHPIHPQKKNQSGYKILDHVGDNTKRLRCVNDGNERGHESTGRERETETETDKKKNLLIKMFLACLPPSYMNENEMEKSWQGD